MFHHKYPAYGTVWAMLGFKRESESFWENVKNWDGFCRHARTLKHNTRWGNWMSLYDYWNCNTRILVDKCLRVHAHARMHRRAFLVKAVTDTWSIGKNSWGSICHIKLQCKLQFLWMVNCHSFHQAQTTVANMETWAIYSYFILLIVD